MKYSFWPGSVTPARSRNATRYDPSSTTVMAAVNSIGGVDDEEGFGDVDEGAASAID